MCVPGPKIKKYSSGSIILGAIFPVQHHCCLCLCLSFFSLHFKSCTWKTIQKHFSEMLTYPRLQFIYLNKSPRPVKRDHMTI